MPRSPHVSPRIAGLSSSVFSRLAASIAQIDGERFPLHVGDTWRAPATGAHLSDFTEASHPGMHRYTRPQGHPELLAALADVRGCHPARTLVTAGATGGLSAVAGTVVDPGDEVVILGPHWPLISGIVRCAHGIARVVPFFDRLDAALAEHGTADKAVAALLGDSIGPSTVALYINTPNNPTGKVLSAPVLAALAAVARTHNLWLWSDEVYDHYTFAGKHLRVSSFAPERTFSAWSFSKAYGIAGARCGTIEVPDVPGLWDEVRKSAMHSVYQAPTVAQLAAARLLRTGDDWLAESRSAYQEIGWWAADALGLDRPEGGTFLFVDVSHALDPALPDDEALTAFLLRCIQQGLILAPGDSCGPTYGRHVRLCFTSAPPDAVRRGVSVLAGLLGQ